MSSPRRVDRRHAPAVPAIRLLLRQTGRLVLVGGRHTDLEPKDALLLAYLAIEGPTPRGRLAAMLWPDVDDERARGNLRQRLLRLRRATGVELLEGNPIAALATGVTHDLEGAEELLEAIDVPTDGALAEWLEAHRHRRHHARRDALASNAARAEAEGDLAAALHHAQALVELDPHSEDAHRTVMRLHYLRGDTAAATAAYERCRRSLERDLRIAPSKETETLQASIRGAVATGPAARSGRDVPASVLRPPRLVGREAAWAALEAAWDAGETAVVAGEAGMGKTRLVTDFARSRPAPVAVVSARPGDEHAVYAVAARLLRQLPETALNALEAPVRRELARLLPEHGDAPPIGSDAERSRFFNAVLHALETAQGTIAGIVVDDLHFADAASIELVRYVASDSGLRWLFAARPAEVGTEARSLIEGARAATRGGLVELSPLTLGQLTELIDSLGVPGLDAERMAPALMRQSGGNPLFALETVKAWIGQKEETVTSRLPTSAAVASLIQRRIGRLSQDAVRLARCAAVAGQDFSTELACHVLGVRPLDLSDAWTELEAAGVFRGGAFAHDLIHEAALASVPPPIARTLHREIATFLGEHGGEPANIAAHRLAAGEDALAIGALEAAAKRCADAGRLVEAGRHYRRAAEIASTADEAAGRTFNLYYQAAEHLWLSASTAEFNELIDPIRRWARTDGELCRYWLAEGHRAEREGRVDAHAEAVERATEFAVKAGERESEATARMNAGHVCYVRGQVERALHHFSAAADMYRGLAQSHNEAAARTNVGAILSRLCRFDEANRQLELAVPWLVEGKYYAYLIANRNTRAANALIAGDARRAVEFASQARSFAATLDAEAGPRAVTAQRQIEALRRLGRFREALEAFDRAQEEFGGEASPDCRSTGLEAAPLFLDLGRRDRTEGLLADFERQANVVDVDTELARLLRLRIGAGGRGASASAHVADLETIKSPARYCTYAVLLASRSENADAAAVLDRALGQARDLGLNAHLAALLIALAERRLEQRDTAGATAACDEATEALADFDSEAYRPELLLRLLRLEQALGRIDRADVCLNEAVNWIRRAEDVHVPAEYRESFVHRNPVNRELLALARRAG